MIFLGISVPSTDFIHSFVWEDCIVNIKTSLCLWYIKHVKVGAPVV